MDEEVSVGLALSGGGAKGICHLGVLEALDEMGINISGISGTSAGALVGAMYAYGYKPKEILEVIRKTSFFKVLKFATSWNGLLHMKNLGDILLKKMPENSFESLKIPLYVATTELKKGETEYFSEGELIKPILASCCVPVIFKPMAYNEGIYVDGGILKNLPAEIIRKKFDKLIGSDCNPIDSNFSLTGVKKLIERSLLLAINGNNNLSKIYCDYVIEPDDMKRFSSFDLTKAEEIFNVGYKHTISIKEDILKALNSRREEVN